MKTRNSRDSLQKAKNYAFLLLKFRPRSEKEICERLKKKEFDDTTIKETVLFLRDKHFLNDNYFARAWIESRLRRPLGLRKIREELRIKGIDKEIIDSQIEGIKKGYCEEDIVRKLARVRFRRLKDIEPGLAKRRIFSYLARRGFSPQVIIDVIDKL